MNNVFVYCEMEGKHVADVSLELLTKGRKLATQLGCQLETICAGTDLADVEKQVLPYGVDRVHVFDAPGLFPYTSLPHTSILVNLFKEEKPQICLMGATVIGRDLGPRVSSALTSGLTADCTQLEIGNHEDKKNGITYENLLYQGKVVVLIFFHTECPDCQKELPVIQQLYEEYATNEEVVIYAISREESEEEVADYWERNSLTIPYSAQDDRRVYELFSTSGIPRVYVCRRDGTIVSMYSDNPIATYSQLSEDVENTLNFSSYLFAEQMLSLNLPTRIY